MHYRKRSATRWLSMLTTPGYMLIVVRCTMNSSSHENSVLTGSQWKDCEMGAWVELKWVQMSHAKGCRSLWLPYRNKEASCKKDDILYVDCKKVVYTLKENKRAPEGGQWNRGRGSKSKSDKYLARDLCFILYWIMAFYEQTLCRSNAPQDKNSWI